MAPSSSRRQVASSPLSTTHDEKEDDTHSDTRENSLMNNIWPNVSMNFSAMPDSDDELPVRRSPRSTARKGAKFRASALANVEQDTEGNHGSGKLRTSRDVFFRLLWEPSSAWDRAACRIGYLDRMDGLLEMGLLAFRPISEGGDIPFHRIWYFKHGTDRVIWDRKTKLDLVFGSGEKPSATLKATEQNASSTAAPKMDVHVESVPSYRYDSAQSDWVETGQEAREDSIVESISIVTWNVLCDLFDGELLYTEERIPAIVDELRRACPDVIVLEEVTPSIARLLLSDQWVRSRYRSTDCVLPERSPPTLIPYGQLILSAYPILRVQQLMLSATKRAIAADIDMGGETVVVVGVHLTSSVNADATKRLGQLHTIINTFSYNDDGDRCNLVIAGDTNMLEADVVPACLTDAWLAVRAPQPTFDPLLNSLAGVSSSHHTPSRFDRVYLHQRAHLHPSAAGLLGTKPFRSPDRFPSDHYGVHVTMTRHEPHRYLADLTVVDNATALQITPPPEVWAPIQTLREQHDPGFRDWPPHINLLWGFLPDRGDIFKHAAALIGRSLCTIKPFRVVLNDFAILQHGSTCTVCLRPDDESRHQVISLKDRLNALFPQCSEQDRHKDGYQPHLTVGAFPSLEEAEKHVAQWQKRWQPLEFTLESVHMTSCTVSSPMTVQASVQLGAPIVSASGTPVCNPSTPLPKTATIKSADDVIKVLRECTCSVLGLPRGTTDVAHVFGSHQLGADDPNSDVDVLTFGPNGPDHLTFFTALERQLLSYTLEGCSPISSCLVLSDATVPLLKVVFVGGLSADVIYARLSCSILPSTPTDLKAEYIVDRASVLAVTGWANGHVIVEFVPEVLRLAYQSALRSLKKWARTRGIYSASMGYVGGFHIAVMLGHVTGHFDAKDSLFAKETSSDDEQQSSLSEASHVPLLSSSLSECDDDHDTIPGCTSSTTLQSHVDKLLRRFFETFAEWQWPRPVMLDGDQSSYIAPHQSPCPMPICYPIERKNCMRNVTTATAAAILSELRRARDLSRLSRWDEVTSPVTNRHTFGRTFLIVQAQCFDLKGSVDCNGWLYSRLIGLLRLLEGGSIEARPVPALLRDLHKEYSTPLCSYPYTVSAVVGLKGEQGAKFGCAVMQFQESFKEWPRRPKDSNLTAFHVRPSSGVLKAVARRLRWEEEAVETR